MSNFDLIDDYLANKLPWSEREAFESNMEADPKLKSEVANQRLIVEGIQKARALELKAMMNKIPVSGGASLWSDFSVLKMAATIGVAGLLGTTLYYYMKDANTVIPEVPKADVKIDSLIPTENNEKPAIEEKETKEEKKTEATSPKAIKSKTKKQKAGSPKVEVVDPSSELLTENGDVEAGLNSTPVISMSTIQVERDAQNKLYSFHYQFWEGKLFLFGPFDEALYEILEVHGNNPALFLYFKDNFYHLDKGKQDITELSPIKDRVLTQKLKEFRSQK